MSETLITDYENKILQRARNVWPLLSEGERAVLTLIVSQGPIRQSEIAKSAPFLGAHPQFDRASAETTERHVRQLIRDLRVTHGVTILSSRAGYKIPQSREETEAYLEAKYNSALAAGRSAMETYRALRAVDDRLQDRPALFDLEDV
jgi:hypothetical protein